MSCEQYRELVSADLDGELSVAEEVTLYAHLSGCDDCRAWRRDQLAIRADLRRWPHEALPPSLEEPPIPAEPVPHKVYRVPRVWAWAAAILILIQSAVTVSSVMNRPPDTMTELDDDDSIPDTIELTSADRTRYTVQTNPVQIPTTPPDRNGG